MMELNDIKKVTARAYASVSNIAVGFDVLGFATKVLHDDVTLTRRDDNQLVIDNIIIEKGELPYDIDKNTATVALSEFIQKRDLTLGFNVSIKKGIPLCSGLGGSAASAIAALTAANQFLKTPYGLNELIEMALVSEAISSGEKHPDNIVPAIFGEFCLIASMHPLQICTLPMMPLDVVLIMPDYAIPTKEARAALKEVVSLKDAIAQAANMGQMMVSLYEKDYALFKLACHDVMIEPQRAHLLPGFYQIQKAAMAEGALGASFSGAGPCLFAFCQPEQSAINIRDKMLEAIFAAGLKARAYISPLEKAPPEVLEVVS